MTETNEKIKCEICSIELKRITRTHLIKHNITTTEYKTRFPNSPIVSDTLAYALGKASRNMSNERRAKISVWAKEFHIGKPKSDDHKLKLSKARIGKSWGKHTLEHREKMREISRQNMLERYKNGWTPRALTAQERYKLGSKISKIRKDKYWRSSTNKGIKLNLSQEQRANRSIKRILYIKNNQTKFSDTTIELNMKKFLEQINMSYIHQFPILGSKGGWLFDFFIPQLNLLLETDGEYYHSSKKQINRDKIKERIARETGYNFLRISDKDWHPETIFLDDSQQKLICNDLITKRLLLKNR